MQILLTGTLMMAEATTSLPYRELLKAETLEFRVAMHYPMFWNDHQEWIFSFVATKVSVRFIYAVKWFFQVGNSIVMFDSFEFRFCPDSI